ncbi:mitochondrial large subunit ribosomal protein-domain-containing protein [Phaeosphaeria sp. MPI-PUGE-AT-0046c]|nr:mitochondrial large subunit ribosomal protein-domain-containing protein [Phaeosphaeria sp. MPI-PUGE-AT-0046c]
MPRIQPFVSLLRPLAAPRTAACAHHLRFSTATSRCAEKPVRSAKPSPPSQAPPAPPTTPEEASRAADLAAAEAITESDSAQPPEPKPDLPSWRADASSQTSKAHDVPPSPPRSRSTQPTAAKTSPNPFKSTPISTPSPASASSTPPTLSIDLPPPKYHVSRSKNGNFPIYTDYKRGGNLHLTTVRKITGDPSALRDELRVWLNKKNEDVKINTVTGHVVVKGHCKEEVQKFLGGRGM